MQVLLDPTDFDPVLKEFDALIGRCEELRRSLRDYDSQSEAERALSLEQFRTLGTDLRAWSKLPAVHEPRIGRALTQCEMEYYRPALERASQFLPDSRADAANAMNCKEVEFLLAKVKEELLSYASLLRRRTRGIGG